MADEEDIDRAAILARRRRFIGMALAGLGTLGTAEASGEPAESQELDELLREPTCEYLGDDLLPLPTPTPVPEDMSEDEREARARELYRQAQSAYADRDYDKALIALEAAYSLVPGKHGFAHAIGEIAYMANRWRMAREYLQHFLDHADPWKYEDKLRNAQLLLNEIRCGTAEPYYEPYVTYPDVCLSIAGPRNPPDRELTARERRKQRRAEKREQCRLQRALERRG